MKTKKTLALYILLFLLAFLSLGALAGGAALIIEPNGGIMQMPVTMLKGSPFNNFLIPGMILFTVLGVFPALLLYPLIKKPQLVWANLLNIYSDMYWAWTYTLYVGFALIIWINVQIFIVKGVHIIHIIYVLLGLVIIAVALLPMVKKHYLKNEQ
ncbi:MAG: hypothetical protein ISS81_02655 [Candidatus Marinimicrobia bacterium]|nr:hypothetical protein [Candidatus Neomarinimicrobiota bacterium]